MALSPKTLALIEQAKKNHAERQAAIQVLAKQEGSISIGNLHKLVDAKLAEPVKPVTANVFTANGSFQPTIQGFEYNAKQLEAIELAMRGKSSNLIGAAGTGKTTTTREVIGQLCRMAHITPIKTSTKYLQKDSPGIVVVSFTNKAVNNLKKFLPPDLKRHCLTYHKLLEFAPVAKSDRMLMGLTGGMFQPTYTRSNPLPHISCVIVEESSMVAGDAEDRGDVLHSQLMAALPDPANTQFIFLGDLNQLPPIFGPSILGFKLNQLQTVELSHVYRQALESPIITLAHKIREGKGIGRLEEGKPFIDDRGEHGKVTIHPWKIKATWGPALKQMQSFLVKLAKTGQYDPTKHMILCPFNKSFGTIELNRALADYYAKERNATVYEVIARSQKSYWAVGDRVLVDRQEAVITRIVPTPGYSGPVPCLPSETLDRWGKDPKADMHTPTEDKELEMARGFDILDSLVIGDDEEQTNDCSHTITVQFNDSELTSSISTAGALNAMVFSYILTVHKAQGSEWEKVFILLHYSHNNMLSRELLYTAITRAKHELFIVCEPDRKEIYNSLTRAAKSPEITGVTLAEKAEYFKAKAKSMKRMADKAESQPRKQQDIEEMEDD